MLCPQAKCNHDLERLQMVPKEIYTLR